MSLENRLSQCRFLEVLHRLQSSRRQRLTLVAVAFSVCTTSALAAPDNLFADHPWVVTVGIELSPDAIARLAARPRNFVFGSATVAGGTSSSVEVRLRGNGSFQPITDKPNFAIKFEDTGRRRLLLSGSAQDSTYLRWKLASVMFHKAGLPAARIGFARVHLNDRRLGLYIMLEPTDRAFLRHHFGSSAGNLYEGSNDDVTDALERDSGNATGGQNALKPLADACQETDLERRWRFLEAVLDVDRFAAFMAMEVLVRHHDGYSLDRNNFRIYGDPTSKRFVFIPHGMDLIFDNPTAPLVGRWRGLVAHAFMETRQGQNLYRKSVVRVVKNVYADDTWPGRIDEWAKVLRPEVGSGDALARWEAAVADLKGVVVQRRKFALESIAQLR